jgi:hypothetical protein
MKAIHAILVGGALALSLEAVHAVDLTFPVGTVVSNYAGTYTVMVGAYQFSRLSGLSINTFTDAWRHVGGLWVNAGAVKIERADGQPFSIDRISIMERPGVNGSIGIGDFTLTAYPAGSSNSFGRTFYTDGNNHNYDTFLAFLTDPKFGNVTAAWLAEEYPFILDSITLGPPTSLPPPSARPTNLVADASLEVNPGDVGNGTVTAGAWTFAGTTTIVPPGGSHRAPPAVEGARVGVIYAAEETGPLPEISQVVNIPVTGRYRLGWWEVGTPPNEGFSEQGYYLNYYARLDNTIVASRQAQNRSGYGALFNPPPPTNFYFVSAEFPATAGPHTLRFQVTGRSDTTGGGNACIDAVSLIPAADAIWPPAALLLAISPPAANAMRLSWPTVPGFFYRLESSEDFPGWAPAAPFQAPLTEHKELIALQAGGMSQFFRVSCSRTNLDPRP